MCVMWETAGATASGQLQGARQSLDGVGGASGWLTGQLRFSVRTSWLTRSLLAWLQVVEMVSGHLPASPQEAVLRTS